MSQALKRRQDGWRNVLWALTSPLEGRDLDLTELKQDDKVLDRMGLCAAVSRMHDDYTEGTCVCVSVSRHGSSHAFAWKSTLVSQYLSKHFVEAHVVENRQS